jgi:23S rRNA pseudouridine2457 synthase
VIDDEFRSEDTLPREPDHHAARMRAGRFMLIAFHKPYGVLSQFTRETEGQRTLAAFGFPPNVYPIGRLDRDSEGLLLLSDEPELTHRLLDPSRRHPREYLVEVEGIPDDAALAALRRGVRIQGFSTLPCEASKPDPQPVVRPRDPPVRFRASIPTCWIILELVEGKNRQVRRMTAAVGYPTLRLIRTRIGSFPLGGLPAGAWERVTPSQRRLVLVSPE